MKDEQLIKSWMVMILWYSLFIKGILEHQNDKSEKRRLKST